MKWVLSLCLFVGVLMVWTALAFADGGSSIEPPNTMTVVIGSVLRVEDGVALAEEKARVLIKLGKAPHSAEKKHEIATDYAMDRVDRAGIRQNWPREVVSHKTDAKVNKKRENHVTPRPPTLPPAP